MAISGVIFDMDGVLVDNRDVHIESFIIFCKKHGITLSSGQLMPFFGMGNDDIMQSIFKRELTTKEIDTYSQEKEQIYRDIYAETIEPVKGLVSFIEQLKARKIKIAVGSSGMRKNVDYVLEKCGIANYIDAIACGDMVKKAKPDPEVFLLAASLLGLKPTECIVFEDSFAGIKAARLASAKVVAVATTFSLKEHTDYDLLISDFTEVDATVVDTIA